MPQLLSRWQRKEPTVLMQDSPSRQLWLPVMHSLTSRRESGDTGDQPELGTLRSIRGTFQKPGWNRLPISIKSPKLGRVLPRAHPLCPGAVLASPHHVQPKDPLPSTRQTQALSRCRALDWSQAIPENPMKGPISPSPRWGRATGG